MPSTNQKRILLGVTGSIAAYKSGDIIRRLMDEGFKVSVIMTKEAESFITPLTLSSLCGEDVYRSMFDENVAWTMPHIRLAKDADLVLIAPATANIIAKIACGMADDLLTCSILATTAPILIAPAMNVEMYRNVRVQNNCAQLKKQGVQFVEPVHGKLACGDEGEGHLAPEENIVTAVKKVLGGTL